MPVLLIGALSGARGVGDPVPAPAPAFLPVFAVVRRMRADGAGLAGGRKRRAAGRARKQAVSTRFLDSKIRKQKHP